MTKTKLCFFLLLGFLSLSPTFGFGEVLDWAAQAVRLTGESDRVRDQALNQLRKEANLVPILRKELSGPRQALALDVISALSLDSLLPDLLKAAEKDRTGFIYLSINNLMTTKNRDRVIGFYRQHLLCPANCRASPPSQVVILDTLGRLGEELSLDELQGLMLEGEWPEVRFSALDYVRLALLQFHRNRYLPLIKKALHGQPVQLREQAVYLISELPSDLKKTAIKDLDKCQEGLSPDVRRLCLWLKQGAP